MLQFFSSFNQILVVAATRLAEQIFYDCNSTFATPLARHTTMHFLQVTNHSSIFLRYGHTTAGHTTSSPVHHFRSSGHTANYHTVIFFVLLQACNKSIVQVCCIHHDDRPHGRACRHTTTQSNLASSSFPLLTSIKKIFCF